MSKATCIADNGNFYSGGTALLDGNWRIYVMKINPYGDTIWTRRIDSLGSEVFAMVASGDGGCVITGDNHYTIKLSSAGGIVWAKYYGGIGIQLYDIIKTSDGGYVSCGEFFDINNFTYNGYLMKLDLNGNLIWQQTYLTGDLKILNSIIENANAEFIVTGTVNEYAGDTLRAFLWKVDSNGNIKWVKKYLANNRICAGHQVGITNANYLVFGQTGDSTGTKTNTFFLRTDTSGNLLYTKIFEANRNEGFYDMKIIRVNRFIFTRTRGLANTLDSYVMIIDTLGNAITEKSFTLPDFVIFRSILLMPNSDFIFAGNGKPSTQSVYKTYIVRTDSALYAPPFGINNLYSKVPSEYVLYQNYPNPFNSSTVIKFEINKPANIQIKFFDIIGRFIKTFINKKLSIGVYEMNADVNNFASGVYVYQLIADGYTISTKKMTLLK